MQGGDPISLDSLVVISFRCVPLVNDKRTAPEMIGEGEGEMGTKMGTGAGTGTTSGISSGTTCGTNCGAAAAAAAAAYHTACNVSVLPQGAVPDNLVML